MLTEAERQSVEANLFPAARHILRSHGDFPWHRDRTKNVTADRPQSSQALAVDLFGTLQTLTHPDAILAAWWGHLGLRASGPWQIELERLISKSVLGEPRSSQIDACVSSPSSIILFECKFTEGDGGSCSQVRPLKTGQHSGKIQCDGTYSLQENPLTGKYALCALSQKGIRYWDYIPEFLGIDSAVTHRPCPFAGGQYQWMRNVVAAGALAQSTGRSGAVVLLYADGGFPMATKVAGAAWRGFRAMTAGRPVPLVEASYQTLMRVAAASCHPGDQAIVRDLSKWVHLKIACMGEPR